MMSEPSQWYKLFWMAAQERDVKKLAESSESMHVNVCVWVSVCPYFLSLQYIIFNKSSKTSLTYISIHYLSINVVHNFAFFKWLLSRLLPYWGTQSIFSTLSMQEQPAIKRKLSVSFYLTMLHISSIDISDSY